MKGVPRGFQDLNLPYRVEFFPKVSTAELANWSWEYPSKYRNITSYCSNMPSPPTLTPPLRLFPVAPSPLCLHNSQTHPGNLRSIPGMPAHRIRYCITCESTITGTCFLFNLPHPFHILFVWRILFSPHRPSPRLSLDCRKHIHQ